MRRDVVTGKERRPSTCRSRRRTGHHEPRGPRGLGRSRGLAPILVRLVACQVFGLLGSRVAARRPPWRATRPSRAVTDRQPPRGRVFADQASRAASECNAQRQSATAAQRRETRGDTRLPPDLLAVQPVVILEPPFLALDREGSTDGNSYRAAEQQAEAGFAEDLGVVQR